MLNLTEPQSNVIAPLSFCQWRSYLHTLCGINLSCVLLQALEDGLTCAQICDKYHAIHADIYKWFDIAFDKFGRTPTRAQTKICESIFNSVHGQDNCVEQSMEQLFSEALGKFLADRFVCGTCPKCGYQVQPRAVRHALCAVIDSVS